MSVSLLLLIIISIGGIGFVAGRYRAFTQNTGAVKIHSRAHYHGWWVFLVSVLPAVFVLALWSLISSFYLEQSTLAILSQKMQASSSIDRSLALGIVKNISIGLNRLTSAELQTLPHSYQDLRALLISKRVALPPIGHDDMIPLAEHWYKASHLSYRMRMAIGIILAIAGAVFSFFSIHPRARARHYVERIILGGLIAASIIAVLTTVGIVFSMFFQTISFFKDISPISFFFGTVWDPRFAGAGSGGIEGHFGFIPLLAGTFYIALISLLFAVPIGLFAAIYMVEYASPRFRAIVKPLLEILAGIPTIVYGFFALITVGPALRDLSSVIAGGHGFIMAQSVLTAGLVMGIMLIPFVSSLSDDIITAVPSAMRDGSLGLGATRSETMKRVILPAALPGIAGALLLTTSRAIGETMIVVLAAGVAAKLSLNPFEAMTTITVKIVNQLTGDLEFNSPQTLVAFALGMTLFILTLAMNIFALYIVRKYQERYE